MKRTTQWFASIFGAISPGRKKPAEPNIVVVRRELIPGEKGNSHALLRFSIIFAQLLLLMLGLCMILDSGFSLTVSAGLLYGGMVLLCLLFAAFFYDNWLTGTRLYGAAALVLLTAVAVLFLQKSFISGFRQIGAAVLEQMNSRYGGDYMLPLVEESARDVSIFLLIVFVPLTAYSAAFVAREADAMLVGLVIFPLVALMLLAGATPSLFAMGCVLLGLVSIMASSRVGMRMGLWGEKNSPRWQSNWLRRQRISAFSALAVGLVGIGLMVPCGVVLMPSLAAPLELTAPFAAEVEGKFAQVLLNILPDRRGSMASPVTTFGGGVDGGALTDGSGYLVSDVEDLSLSVTVKPQETLYLRGFVGGSYSDNRWLPPDEGTFNAAAANWETEGEPDIYVQNMPFLRMLYEENAAGEENSFAELTVVRINANDSYTYVPYGAYLNDYYELSADGAVTGQSVQDDIFNFYSRQEQMQTLEEEFFLQNESALDRLERSYRVYAQEHYTRLPEGFQELQTVCDDAELSDAPVEDVIAFVQEYLTGNYTYSLSAPQVPEGEDAVRFFLQESRTGNSTHFASAATIMFRMLGVPARYVVGYAASESLFTPQPNGTYHAVLQSDNAHAWTEIYITGTGWMPVETTPGILGLVQDVEYYGDELNPGTSAPTETTASEQTEPDAVREEKGEFPVGIVAAAAGIVLMAALAAVWLRRVRDLGLNRRFPAAKRLRCIFAAYYRRLLWAGMPGEVDSTSSEFPGWVRRLDPQLSQEDFRRMMELVLGSCFGQQHVREKDVVWLRKLYLAGKKRIRKLPKKAKK